MSDLVENIAVTVSSETRLHPLAFAVRQVLRRIRPESLATMALLTGLSSEPALAAVINVDAGCTLIDAISAANIDASTGGCSAGKGADTIVLPVNSVHILTAVNNVAHFDNNGLPVISSSVTIAGRGSTIQRDSTAPDFRILAVGPTGNLTLNSVSVKGGKAMTEVGGGLFNSGMLTLNNSTVSENSSFRGGGGIINFYGTITLNNSTVSSNTAGLGSDGGGLKNYKGSVTLNNSTASGNNSAGSGGGLSTVYGQLTINNSTISGNSALQSGGLENFKGSVSLTNSTVSGNSAGNFGGGLSIWHGGSLTLSNSTVSGNSAGSFGGGLYNLYGLSILSNSIVSGNSAGVAASAEIGNSSGALVYADDHNLFGHDGNAGVLGFTPGATDIVPIKALSAILKPLAANGGPTQTHLLPKGSPAIDASPVDAQCAKIDQRGVPRPRGSACDIGALEVTFCDTATPTTGCTVNGVANQRCEGTEAADTIIGTGGNDIIRGLGGNDILKGVGGNDQLCGELGNDRLDGGIGLDQLFGGFGFDRLLGGDGDDNLLGDQDNDILDGGLGTDKLNGGPGIKDTCTTDIDDSPTSGCEL